MTKCPTTARHLNAKPLLRPGPASNVTIASNGTLNLSGPINLADPRNTLDPTQATFELSCLISLRLFPNRLCQAGSKSKVLIRACILCGVDRALFLLARVAIVCSLTIRCWFDVSLGTNRFGWPKQYGTNPHHEDSPPCTS